MLNSIAGVIHQVKVVVMIELTSIFMDSKVKSNREGLGKRLTKVKSNFIQIITILNSIV